MKLAWYGKHSACKHREVVFVDDVRVQLTFTKACAVAADRAYQDWLNSPKWIFRTVRIWRRFELIIIVATIVLAAVAIS
jgi:hypothetical protein